MSERDLLNWALTIVAAEENARLMAETIAEKIQVEVTPTPTLTSKIIRKVNINIPDTLIDEVGSGHLKELVIKTSSKNYILRVYVDESELYHNTYTWFQNISQEVEEIDAYEENGTYILRLSDINFTKNLKIIAEPSITILPLQKINELFCKIDKKT
jgi:hypothetical protein